MLSIVLALVPTSNPPHTNPALGRSKSLQQKGALQHQWHCITQRMPLRRIWFFKCFRVFSVSPNVHTYLRDLFIPPVFWPHISFLTRADNTTSYFTGSNWMRSLRTEYWFGLKISGLKVCSLSYHITCQCFQLPAAKNCLLKRIFQAIFKVISCFFKYLILDIMKFQLMQM